MNRYNVISLFGLLLIVTAVPLYMLREPQRMEQAQVDLRQEFVDEAAVFYVDNCAVCHGATGEGIGATLALNNPALREADYDALYKVIARGRYGTTMAGWHQDEGGLFNDYQIEELIALIRYADWSQVGEVAAQRGMVPSTLPVPQVDDTVLEEVAALDPQGAVWAQGIQLYAQNCIVCHGVNGEGTDLGPALNTEEIRGRETAELIRIINEGVPTTMMAAWRNILSLQEVESLVAFLQNWDTIAAQEVALPTPEPLQIDVDDPEERLALGERLFATTCAVCHGESGSGDSGPTLNSQQILTRLSDEQIQNIIVNGGTRPRTTMPAFGDRLTAVEIASLVEFIRAWEPTAPWVQNPRGTAQGGGPPWLRATPDANDTTTPGGGPGQGGRGGGPPWQRQSNN